MEIDHYSYQEVRQPNTLSFLSKLLTLSEIEDWVPGISDMYFSTVF